MIIAAETAFWLSAGALFYTYVLYYLLLLLYVALVGKYTPKLGAHEPALTVIVAARNEAAVIENRIHNILRSSYPLEKLEIIVGSDGSTDDTRERCERLRSRNTVVLDFPVNRGKALVHNDCVAAAKGEIIVFTDAETEFEPDFLEKMARNYADEKVGCVVGRLGYKSAGSAISISEGMYFRYELALRKLESKAGILATATGACMSVRKNLYRTLEPVDDSDFTTPIDCVKAGYKVVYEPEAIAYDVPPATAREEIRARIRMTAKNFIGTLRRLGPGFWRKRPLALWGLVSHKFLRWLTGYFLAGAFIFNLIMLGHGQIYYFTMVLQGAAMGLFMTGYVADKMGKHIPVASQIYSFLIASYAMAVGVLHGLTGKFTVKWSKA